MALTSGRTHSDDVPTEPKDQDDTIKFLLRAAAAKKWDLVIQFIDNPVNTISLKTLFCSNQDKDGQTILHLAANRSNILLKKIISINF